MTKQSRKQRKPQDAALKAENNQRATNVFMQLLALVPAEQQAPLIGLMLDEARLNEPERTREELLSLLTSLDLESQRQEIVRLLLELIPVEHLVPTVYEKYRPMVRDAADLILSHLSAERLRIKLVEQLMLPLEASLQERLLMLIARMPTLQKMGQIIARNRNLDPEFRRRLQKLENSIRDASYESIFERIQSELKNQMQTYKIKLSSRFLAEASVCAVLPFTWRSPDGERRRGVFKVLKPFISRYWAEELQILNKLASYLDRHRSRYGLPTIGFRELLREVRELLKREVKLPIEQNRLQEAQSFYSQHTNVQVPTLLPMRTELVTGMEFVDGLKVTAAANRYPDKRSRIAELILNKLIVSVLFHPGAEALFHADPHAGNLFYGNDKDALVLFDWGLSCTLSRSNRRELVQLILGFILHDLKRSCQAACNLTNSKLSRAQVAIIEEKVEEIFHTLPLFPLVRLEPLTRLLDELILAGIKFPAELLMFRKSLFTLLGVLHDVDANFDVDWHLTRSLLGQILREIPNRLLRSPWSRDFPSQITTWELRDVLVRLSQLAAKLGVENTQLLAQLGLDWASDLINRLTSPFKRPASVKSEV
ncbi:MAG: AarF/UbiB family protein [Acidobacteriota bacterium]